MEPEPKVSISLLKDIEIQGIEEWKKQNLPQKNQQLQQRHWNRKYFRHHIFYHIRNKFLTPNNCDNSDVNHIITKYFTYSLNPIYEKASKLPKKIFVCGYCKEPFFGPAEYIKHCHMEQCPINHDRSTFLFHVKNKFTFIKNSDIPKMMTEKEIQILVRSSYGKQHLLFSDYDIRIKSDSNKSLLECPNCSFKTNQSNKCKLNILKTHYILKCTELRDLSVKNIFKVRRYDQNPIDFVKDISNFYLNYNILTLFQDSYIRIIQNPENKNEYSLFCCSTCMSKFSSQQNCLQHFLFQCSCKLNPNSSHIVKRKLVPTTYDSIIWRKNRIFLDLQKIQNRIRQQNQILKNNKIYQQNVVQKQNHIQKSNIFKEVQPTRKIWEQRINEKYEDLKDLFRNIYLCGQCLHHFKTSDAYLAHCIVFLCPLNHERNSHYYFSNKNCQTLNIQSISQEISSKTIKQVCSETKIEKILKYILINKQTNKEEQGHRGQFKCGKCLKKRIEKDSFISHVLKVCLSSNYQETSHEFEIVSLDINEKTFEEFIISLLYGVQIQNYSRQRKYQITRNYNLEVEMQFYCGKCDTAFSNQYQYVFHSISVCKSLRSKNSSHYIISSASKNIQHPLDVVEQKTLSGNIIKININYFIHKSHINKKRLESQQKNMNQQKNTNLVSKIEEIQFNKMDQNQKHCKFESYLKYEIQKTNLEQGPFIQNMQFQNIELLNQIAENKKIVQGRRFIRYNTDFIAENKSSTYLVNILEFYCGQCRLDFKRKDLFIDHLEQCKEYQNKLSSHFYISNNQLRKINQMIAFTSGKKNTLLPEEYSIYRLRKDDSYTCGCGQYGAIQKFKKHIFSHNFEGFKGGSHVILRIMQFDSIHTRTLILQLSQKSANPTHQFVCPCKPWKKHSYGSFAKHIMKRHDGKSPRFHMKLPESQIELLMHQRQTKEVIQI